MSQIYLNDLNILVKNICDIGSQLQPGSEDDLEALLTWLNPNEVNSNHQLRPPALRLKNTIRIFINQPLNKVFGIGDHYEGINRLESEFLLLLRQYYVFEVRIDFFSKLEKVLTFKDIQKLEYLYEFPLKHVSLFQNNPEEWLIEQNGLRHYLFNKNVNFKLYLKQRLRDLIMRDDFDLAWEIISWLNQARESPACRDMVLELMLLKISEFCEEHMKNVYDRRFLIMETFNAFIVKYWNYFAKFLDCPEDDHGLTTIIYNCFSKQFVKMRIREIFDVFIIKYPDSKPTIMEMKKVMVRTNDFKQLVMEFLSSFETRILNPSITTVDALLAYVKSIKAFLLLDPSGKYLNSVTSFVKGHFQQREDLVLVLLYAILDLQTEEAFENSTITIDTDHLRDLAIELRDPEFNIDSGTRMTGFTSDHADMKNNKSYSLDNVNKDRLLYQDILEKFLLWKPEPTDSIPRQFTQAHKGLLDVLMTMFESKNFFISEFLKLLRQKLLTLKYYKLDRNWSKCLRLMRDKMTDKDIKISGNEPGSNDESSNINNMDVMLRDIKYSEQLCKKMHQVTGLDSRIFPKFISFLYWDRKFDHKNDADVDFKLSDTLFQELQKYCNVYKELQPGRTLQLCKNQGTVELDLTFKDGTVLSCDATIEQCTAIQLFDAEDTQPSKKLTVEEVSSSMEITVDRSTKLLQFWVEKGALYKFGQFYCSSENADKKGTEKITAVHVQSTQFYEHNSEIAPVQALSGEIWPLVDAILTNLGPLKLEKIHTYLKLTLPKNPQYDALTHHHLRSCLQIYIDDGNLLFTPNQTYKLNT